MEVSTCEFHSTYICIYIMFLDLMLYIIGKQTEDDNDPKIFDTLFPCRLNANGT